MRRKLWRVVALAVASASGVASAHIDPASVIFEKVGRARRTLDYETLVAEGRLVQPGQPDVPVGEGIWTGQGHRRELRRPGETEVLLTRGVRRWRIVNGSASTPVRIRPDPIQTFLVAGGADGPSRRGMALLAAYGIDATVVSLARQNGRPCYVIGASPDQPELPQLWLDKELLAPARLVFTDGGVRTEMRWTGFDSPVTGPFFFRTYEERADDELLLRIEIDRTRVNAAIDDRQFQPPRS